MIRIKINISTYFFFFVQGTYGFCEFEDLRDAQAAVRDLDGKGWLGGRVRIEHARDSRSG